MQKNKRHDTKNIELVKLIAQNKYSAKEIPTLLYGTDNKSAYHALRNGYLILLIDFLASKSMTTEVSEDVRIMKLLLAGRALLKAKQIQGWFRCIIQSRKICQKYSAFFHFK